MVERIPLPTRRRSRSLGVPGSALEGRVPERAFHLGAVQQVLRSGEQRNREDLVRQDDLGVMKKLVACRRIGAGQMPFCCRRRRSSGRHRTRRC